MAPYAHSYIVSVGLGRLSRLQSDRRLFLSLSSVASSFPCCDYTSTFPFTPQHYRPFLTTSHPPISPSHPLHPHQHARAVQIRTQYTQNLQKEGRSKSEIAASLKAGIPVSVGLIDRSKLAVVEGNGSDRIDPVNGREERERLGKEREKRESGSA